LCSECGGRAHLPEECPAAVWYGDGTPGACEAWFVRHDPEGRALAPTHGYGTAAYHQAVADGLELAHAVGACGAH
jgi:hypothetical protein